MPLGLLNCLNGDTAMAMAERQATTLEPLTNPEDTYQSPAKLATDVTLTPKQRIEALDRWELSIQDRLAASNEGMPTNNRTPIDLDLLAQIQSSRKRLRNARW